MKKKITEEIENDYLMENLRDDGVRVLLKDFIENVKEYVDNNVYLKMYFGEYAEGCYNIGLELELDREETDEEYTIRIAKEKELLDRKEQVEREQYLKLKSKFEPNGDK